MSQIVSTAVPPQPLVVKSSPKTASPWRPAAILLALAAWALASIWLAQNPHNQDLAGILSAPGVSHWLGTDHLGRDVLARLAEAVRVSLGLAVASASLAVCVGAALGLLAAWWGGWVDRACNLLADAIAAIPGLLWVLLIGALAPGQKWALYSGLVLTAWVEFFRFIRPTARGLLMGDQVQATRMLGFDSPYVLRWHIWPPLSGSLLKLWSYSVANAVLALAALGFINVGVRPPSAELGQMMTEALPYYGEAPWLLAAPVLLLAATVLVLQSLSVAIARRFES
jgi:peptide/nickel transport system permease protein